MTLTEASYSEGEVLAGSVIPSPPMRAGSARRSRSTSDTSCSVIAGIRTLAIARSSGFSSSAISGSVLRKYVHRCRNPKAKAA